MSDIRCIGIATGGGDAPGLNAVIRAATKAAILKHQWKVIGIPDGLIWPEKSVELSLERVSGILPRGGTILGTTNRGNPFHYRTEENGQEVVRDISDEIIANSKKLGIDAIITIGGDGSQKIGQRAFSEGPVKIVGVPKTIDNDLSATEITFGFDTALHTVSDAIDKIHTTAASHQRVMVVEVMGRDCGWIALSGGISGGAHIILIPEIPFTIKGVCEFIAQRERRGSRFTICCGRRGHQTAARVETDCARGPSGESGGRSDFPHLQQRGADQRVGAHSARWVAFAVRPGVGHPFRCGCGRPDCRREIWKDGCPARGHGGGARRSRRDRKVEDREPRRGTGTGQLAPWGSGSAADHRIVDC